MKSSGHLDAIGVDVMSLEDKRFNENPEKIHEFFRLMTRQFTADEWMQIKSEPNLQKQLAHFFRFWTLKESFVKGHGHGLAWNLQRLSFKVKSVLEKETVVCDSELCLDGELNPQWHFEETLLDPKHCVTTALKGQNEIKGQKAFTRLTCAEILDSLELLTADLTKSDSKTEWNEYLTKVENKPF